MPVRFTANKLIVMQDIRFEKMVIENIVNVQQQYIFTGYLAYSQIPCNGWDKHILVFRLNDANTRIIHLPDDVPNRLTAVVSEIYDNDFRHRKL